MRHWPGKVIRGARVVRKVCWRITDRTCRDTVRLVLGRIGKEAWSRLAKAPAVLSVKIPLAPCRLSTVHQDTMLFAHHAVEMFHDRGAAVVFPAGKTVMITDEMVILPDPDVQPRFFAGLVYLLLNSIFS